jgi:hypothetical protein
MYLSNDVMDDAKCPWRIGTTANWPAGSLVSSPVRRLANATIAPRTFPITHYII